MILFSLTQKKVSKIAMDSLDYIKVTINRVAISQNNITPPTCYLYLISSSQYCSLYLCPSLFIPILFPLSVALSLHPNIAPFICGPLSSSQYYSLYLWPSLFIPILLPLSVALSLHLNITPFICGPLSSSQYYSLYLWPSLFISILLPLSVALSLHLNIATVICGPLSSS